jgi:phage gp29-like protein
MAKLLDQYGNPLDSGQLREPQTARISTLANFFLTSVLEGLTPARLALALSAADQGDLLSQARIFSDMEERDPHLACEIAKRKNALLTLDWQIVPPRDASAAEKASADWLTDVLTDASDPFEDLLLSAMDAVGHGFAATELEWRREGKDWLPAFHPRPQEWFRLSQDRRELRLSDASGDGAPLQPFGWVLHTQGKAKTGYLGRLGLHRVVSWPFLYKAYAVGDFAEFLETYGLPIILGKYGKDAKPEEKASLMRAVTALGHDARATMPVDMAIEIQKVTGSGDGTPHLAMVKWADDAQSKAILGQVLSADAKATGLGSGVADLHDQVRKDILHGDARQVGATITRDLLYPLLALNRGADSLSRCPRLVFDTGEAEDLTRYADALPKLVAVGMTIPASWAHDKLRIPAPQEGEAVLSAVGSASADRGASAGQGGLNPAPQQQAALAALKAGSAPAGPPPGADAETRTLETAAAGAMDTLLARIEAEVAAAPDLASLQARLVAMYGDLDSADLVRIMAAAFALAELKGIADVREAV